MENNKVSRLWPILIIVSSYGYIIYKINAYSFGKELTIHFSNLKIIQLSIIQVILLFMNLSFESLKWKALLSPIEKTSYLKSLKMVIAGYTSGIFTPGKFGEPIGRNLFVKEKKWLETASLNYFGGFIQNCIIFIVAFISSFLLYTYRQIPWLKTILLYSIFLISIIIISIFLTYLNKKRIKHLFSHYTHLKIAQSIIQIKEVLELITSKIIIQVLLFNILRYLVFCCQLTIMFYYIDLQQFHSEIIRFIPIYYLGVTLIPSFVLADLGIRNSVALFIFTFVHQNTFSIMFCVSTLWIINQIIPAIIGSVFFLKKVY